MLGILAALAEFEHAMITERTKVGIAAARARGRNGRAPFEADVYEAAARARLPWASLETKIGLLCRELGVTRRTLYRHLAPDGSLREQGAKALGRRT